MRVPKSSPDRPYDPLFARRNRLFVLGAGFSAAAGIPMTGDLLARAMGRLAIDAPGAFAFVSDKVRRHYRLESEPDYAKLPMAEVCTLLAYHELCEVRHAHDPENPCLQLEALRFCVSKVIAESMPREIPTLYSEFVGQLGPGDVVVSFNWDCLLEAAMTAAEVQWHYGGARRGVCLLKMHGSINWRRGLPLPPARCEWRALPMYQKDPSVIAHSSDLMRDGPHWQGALAPKLIAEEVAPLIVLPGYGKAFDVRRLADLWSLPAGPGSKLNVGGDVFVVGLSLERDDFIIQALLRETLQYVEGERRVTVVNPDPRCLDNYAFLVGRPNVSFLCKNFDESDVRLMELSAKDARWQ